MSSAPRKTMIIAVGVTALFLAGLIQLFLLRFKTGDVYPAYSSLRADPLGIQVLFESLNRTAENSAQRNFQAPGHIRLTSGTTVLICGLSDDDLFLENPQVRDLMDQVALSGGRLVLTFTQGRPVRDEEKPEEEIAQQPAGDSDGSETGESMQDDQTPMEATAEAQPDDWQGAASLGFEFKRSPVDEPDDTAFGIVRDLEGLPAMIPWRAALSFELEDETWETLYAWQEQPVVVQRPWGRGTVVMMADSYLFSNEALRSHRHADLLAWVLVPGHLAIFDEFHHGLVRQRGISALARQYRLHGVFGALMVVVALLVWRQAAVFVPPDRSGRESADPPPAAGRDTAEGLVNLVRQHIAARELLDVCYRTWLPYGTQRVTETQVAQVRTLVQQAAADPKHHHPVDIYRRICELLKQGRYSGSQQ